MSTNKIIITGASGFVGKALCRHFAITGHPKILAIVRDVKKISDLLQTFPKQITPVICRDISNPVCLSKIISRNDVIVHLAARVHILNEQAKNPQAEFQRVNVTATKKLAEIAKQNQAAQFILISSIGVNGKNTIGTPFSETNVPNPKGDYATSKYHAELATTSILNNSKTEWTILRPPLVYGKDAKGNLDKLIGLIKKQLLLPFGCLTRRRHFIYIENLTSAIIAVINSPQASDKQAFLVSDNESFSTSELITMMSKMLKLKTKVIKFPLWLLNILFICIGKKDQLDKLNAELLVNNAKIKATLNWQPPYTLKKGLEKIFK